jgi:hypothetical protein
MGLIEGRRILNPGQDVGGEGWEREILPNLHLSAKNRIIPDYISTLKQ